MKNNKISSLKSNIQIKQIYIKGKNVKNNEYVFKYLPNSTNTTQIAISPNKKHFKTAVLRNKIKRQIRSMVRSMNIKKSINVLIIVLPNYINNSYIQNFNSLNTLFNKI